MTLPEPRAFSVSITRAGQPRPTITLVCTADVRLDREDRWAQSCKVVARVPITSGASIVRPEYPDEPYWLGLHKGFFSSRDDDFAARYIAFLNEYLEANGHPYSAATTDTDE